MKAELLVLFIILLSIAACSNDVSYDTLVNIEEVEIEDCSDKAQMIIEELGWESIKECTDEEYIVDGVELHYVNVESGVGMDCPSGCIYENKNVLFVGSNYEEFNEIKHLDGHFGSSVNDMCKPDLFGYEKNLVNNGEYYIWELNFDYQENEYCSIEGVAIYDSFTNTYDFSGISYEIFIPLDCDSELLRDYLCGNGCQTEEEEFDRCYEYMASVEEDVSYCEIIEDENYKKDCYVQLIYATEDESLCQEMINFEVLHACDSVFSEESHDMKYSYRYYKECLESGGEWDFDAESFIYLCVCPEGYDSEGFECVLD